MKRSILAVSFLLLCALATPAFASGVLVDSKGSVAVTMPGGKKAAAKTGVELPDGTKISVGAKGAASIMMMDGSIQEIGSGQNYTIGSASKPKGKQTVINGIALAINEATATSGGPTVHGMVKMGRLGPGEPKPALIDVGAGLGPKGTYPVETTIEMPFQIIFEWSANSKFDFKNPVIVVENSTNNKIATRKIIPQRNNMAISANELKLSAGNSYSWYFASDEKGKISGKSRHFNFSILSDAEKKRMDDDIAKVKAINISEDGKKFLTAQLYFRSKMIDAMVKELLPLWQKDRSDAVKKLLFMGYARMGLAEEAKKYQ